MAITYNETSVDKCFAHVNLTITAAGTSEWVPFAAPMSAFTLHALHSTTGTFACTLQGSVNGSDAFTIDAITNTDGASFTTGVPCSAIRINIGSMASSGSIDCTVLAKDHA